MTFRWGFMKMDSSLWTPDERAQAERVYQYWREMPGQWAQDLLDDLLRKAEEDRR